MTPTFICYSGTNNHIANLEIGEGKYSHKFFSCGKGTKDVFGYDQVLLAIHTNNYNEWDVAQKLNKDFNGVGFQPW